MRRYILQALALFALCLLTAETNGQTFVNWTGTTGNWTDANNWFNEGTMSPGSLPSVDFEEIARIDGGDVTVNTALADTTINGFSANPGQLLLGNLGGVSQLTIASGGSLHVDAGLVANGFLDIGFGPGTGTVRVLPGGSLQVDGFFSTAGNAANVIQLGAATGAGTATAQVDRSFLNGTTIIYPNANYSTTNQLEIGAVGTYRPVVAGGSVATVDVGGPLRLFGGTLQVDNGGAALPLNTPLTLFEADGIFGSFNQVDTSLLGAVEPGQAYVTNVTQAAGDRIAFQFSRRQMAVLNVDRDSGEVWLTNLGSTGVTIDGYTISSGTGALAVGSWNSLQDAGALGGSWQESPGTANRLSELKETGVGTIAGGATVTLGNIFAAGSADFGVDTEDLLFSYTTTDGNFEGIINYTGSKVNTLLLEVDPVTGLAHLRNTSEDTVAIDGYTVSSASGLSLDPTAWNSLESRGAAVGDWSASPGTTARLSELKDTGGTTLAPGASFELGEIFDTAQAQDLEFEFVLADAGAFDPIAGRVLYQSAIVGPLAGDFNNNGAVENGDLTLLLNNWGAAVPPVPAGWTGDQPTTPAIDNSELTALLNNWGNTAGAGAGVLGTTAVPEPGTCALVLVALSICGLARGSRR